MSHDSEQHLESYINALLRLQREQREPDEAELRQIAIETGMSEEDLALAKRRAGEHLNRGTGFMRYENWGPAIEELEQAVALSPGSARALGALAMAHWRRDERDDETRARAYAERALRIDSTNDEALRIISAIDKGEQPTVAGEGESPARGRRPVALFAAIAVLVVGLGMFAAMRGGEDEPTTTPASLAPATPATPPTPPTPPTPAATAADRDGRDRATLAQTIGSEGIGAGMMQDARTIAVASDGRIFVGEYSDGRIQVFDSTGAFLTMWSIGKNHALHSLAVDRAGTAYLVYGGEIHRFDADGNDKGTLRYAGGRGFEGASTTPDGGIIASWNGHYRGGLLINPESRDAIVRFDKAGRTVRVLKRAVSRQTESFESNIEVVEDGLGNIYAVGSRGAGVLKFDPTGKFLDRFTVSDSDGAGHGWGIEAIAVDGAGRILLLSGNEVLRFDAEGQPIDRKVLKSHASDFAVTDRGEILTVARTKVERYR